MMGAGGAVAGRWSAWMSPSLGGGQAIASLSVSPTGQTVRCRIVNIKDDGTIQVVPEHAVVVDG
jgi:hypothetical protein